MVPSLMGTSYSVPVRLSVMVKVSLLALMANPSLPSASVVLAVWVSSNIVIPFSDLLKGRAQVFDDVVPVFEADREADAARLHAAPTLYLFGEHRVSHRVRLLDERAKLAEADGERDRVGVVGHVIYKAVGCLGRLFLIALEDEVEHASGREFAVIRSHLPAGELVLRMCFETGVADARDLRVQFEELRDPERRLLLVGHARGKCRQAVDEYRPGVFGREHAAH